MERIDSTHSTWWFDTEELRFCRLPRGVAPAQPPLEREWQPYYALDLGDGGAFTVSLNEEHTRLLRAWREEAEPTTELHLVPES
jgi:hypothetical protein